MAKKIIQIRIPMIVTADGKWAACGSHYENDADWSNIDEMCDFENQTVMPMRYWIETSVDVPEVETIGAQAKADIG